MVPFVPQRTNECHNRMLRSFIHKGKKTDDYSADSIMYFADVINNIPRKILEYHTLDELFEGYMLCELLGLRAARKPLSGVALFLLREALGFKLHNQKLFQLAIAIRLQISFSIFHNFLLRLDTLALLLTSILSCISCSFFLT